MYTIKKNTKSMRSIGHYWPANQPVILFQGYNSFAGHTLSVS